MNNMFGRFLEIPAVLPMLSKPGSIDSADAEPAIKPSVLRNSLLVCLFILVPFTRSCMDYLIKEKSSFQFYCI
jgi:hypothetical protein